MNGIWMIILFFFIFQMYEMQSVQSTFALRGDADTDCFGQSVAVDLSINVMVIGAAGCDATVAGYVRLYNLSDFSLILQISASSSGGQFGGGVAISQNVLAIGSATERGNGGQLDFYFINYNAKSVNF